MARNKGMMARNKHCILSWVALVDTDLESSRPPCRYSIPETEPVGVPRVRSTTAISSMLLPVCKAYPSQEGLARSSSDTTDASLIRAESWLPVGSLSSGSAASPPSLSSVQVSPAPFAREIRALLLPAVSHHSFSVRHRLSRLASSPLV